MSNDPRRRPGTVYLGTVPAGTVMTVELIQRMMETQPRQPFDIDLLPNAWPPTIMPAKLLGDEWD